jgi:hypothetical protein
MSYTLHQARYAKGKMAIHAPNDGTGYKTREHKLAENLGGRWSNREKCYIVSVAAARDFVVLERNGWSGNMRLYNDTPSSFYHPDDVADSYTRREALARCTK